MAGYSEFRIRIEPGTRKGQYRVDATGLGGEKTGVFRVPFQQSELENFVLKVGRTRRGVRRISSPEWDLAKTFGGRLFSSLMEGPVGELYRSSFSTAQATGDGVRITLSLTEVPELAEIPWEYLFDPPNFLAISTSTPIVRYLDVAKPRRPLEVALPIRILAVVSSPTDVEVLDTNDERGRLESALKPLIDANAVSIDWLEEATLLALTKKLQPDTYHILHFIGHGGFDDASGEGALLFEDAAGRGRPISGEQLATVLNNKTSLRLVFLNSCEGARASIQDPFSGVASSLIQREIPAVIAMQFEITDRAAIIFAGEFYAVLAEGQPVDSAVTHARLMVFADQNDVEWGTPVLFMRVADGQLFNVADAPALPRVAPEDLPPKTVPSPTGGPPPTTSPTGGPPPTTSPTGGPPPTTSPTGGPPPTTSPTGGPAPTTSPTGGPPPTTSPTGGPPPTTSPPATTPPTTTPPATTQPATTSSTTTPPATTPPTTTPPATTQPATTSSTTTPPATTPPVVEPGTPGPPDDPTAKPAVEPGTAGRPDDPTAKPDVKSDPTPGVTSRIPWRLVTVGAVALVLLVLLVRVLVPPDTSGSLSVSTVGASQTGLITASGKDFVPAEMIDVSLDGDVVKTVLAGGDGRFTTQIDIGQRTHGVVSVVGASGRQASTEFSVAPSGSASPSASAGASPTASAGASPSASAGASPTPPNASPQATTTTGSTSPGILFYSDRSPGSKEKGDNELYLIDPETRVETQLTNNTNADSFPAWSPDHKQIVWAQDMDLVISAFNDGKLAAASEHLTTNPRQNDLFPAWSVDDWIAFVRIASGAPDSQIRKIKPGGTSQFVVAGKTGRQPAWSPDGSTLAYSAADASGQFDIFTIKEGEEPVPLLDGPLSELNPSWSPDGKTIVFFRDKGQPKRYFAAPFHPDNDIFKVDVATKEVTGPLTDNDVQDGNPVWSPDGSQIAFYRALEASATTGYHLWIMNADGSGQEDLMPGRPGQNLDPMWR